MRRIISRSDVSDPERISRRPFSPTLCPALGHRTVDRQRDRALPYNGFVNPHPPLAISSRPARLATARPAHRAPPCAAWSTTLALLAGACLLPMLAGCAAVPGNTVAEQLDERTGTTVTRIERPLELVSTEPRGSNTDPFAYVAPFETNRMGQRELYLWVAVPDERGGARPPVVLAGTETLRMTPRGADAKALGLAAFPYPNPAPWSAVNVYSIDESTLRALASAGSIEVSVRYADERVIRFTGAPRPADILPQFLRNLGL
jgi:hypothetical protein